MKTHTPAPWRIGDAGHTVFGPKTDKPSPEIVAANLTRANARIIAAAPTLLHAAQAYLALDTRYDDLTEDCAAAKRFLAQVVRQALNA